MIIFAVAVTSCLVFSRTIKAQNDAFGVVSCLFRSSSFLFALTPPSYKHKHSRRQGRVLTARVVTENGFVRLFETAETIKQRHSIHNTPTVFVSSTERMADLPEERQ